MTGATAFIEFNRLSTELRLEIWEHAVRIPRIIHVDSLLRPKRPRRQGLTIKIDGVVREQVCPLLLVGRESRRVAMKSLVLFDISMPLVPACEAHYFAISNHDIVHVRNNALYDLPSWLHVQGESKRITNLMIDSDIEGSTQDWGMLLYAAGHLINQLGNQQCLENFYCLWWESSRNETSTVESDDLHEFCDDQFPKHKRLLSDWLGPHYKRPIERVADSSEFQFNDHHNKLRSVWKDITRIDSGEFYG
ncbi:hypothetical protein F5Y09DRAFT_318576 [Xylaria sp. FL1042]|nr:hypothetical protein F5Y09DRAFT_318576 [Xylaria sp. FL1042]